MSITCLFSRNICKNTKKLGNLMKNRFFDWPTALRNFNHQQGEYGAHISSLLTMHINSTKERQHYFDILKAFFVRHSSEYKTLDSDQKVNRNIYPDAGTRDKMRLIDPKSGLLGPIRHCLLEES